MYKCCIHTAYFTLFCFFDPAVVNNITGNSTRFVIIATKRVREVSQPRAWVPPKSEKQKITKPAVPVCN